MPKSAICSQPIEMFLIFDMVRVGKTTYRKERVCMELIICDHDIVETRVIEKSVIDYCKGRNVQVLIRCCTNWQELTCLLKEKPADGINLPSRLKETPADTVIVAKAGVAGLDIITGLKVSLRRLIWFSDLDFGVQAYRLGIPYFNMKPITHEKVYHALKMIEES